MLQGHVKSRMLSFDLPYISSDCMVAFYCQDVFSEPWSSQHWRMSQQQMIPQVRAGVRSCSLCSLKAQVTQSVTLYNLPHHLNSQSTHWLSALQASTGERQDKKTYWAILWVRALLCEYVFFFILFHYFLSMALCFSPAQANKLYQQIQLSNALPRSIRPETNFGRQQWKKKKNQASSQGRDRGAECKLPWQGIPGGFNCKKKL